MVGTFDVYMGKEAAGRVTVTREGLYYRFHCRCKLSGEVMHQLMLRVGQQEMSLGILAPEKGEFGVKTRIPVKHFEKGEPCFWLAPRHKKLEGLFVPISADEPFPYLSRLKNSYLEIRNGQMGAVIPADQGREMVNPTGQ
ncbi:MAG: hypothetical protein IJW94_04110 [Oscillospiraceae bacterium]|nr:hypothetical protein [Oscillospiraceae bacterium]